MGKPKKGSRQDDDFDSDNDDVGPQQQEDTQSQSAGQPAKKAEKKKNKKKGKQKDDDDWGESESKTIDALADIDDMDEDIPVAASKKNKSKKKGMSAFAMLAEMDGDDGNDDFSDNDMEEEAPVVSKKSKGKPKGTSAFAMLSSMDDGNDMGDDDFEDNKSDAEEDSVKEDVSAQKSKKKEKTKKKKKEEEDIDAILADIEKPTSKADKKKKKNKKGDPEEEEVVEVVENKEEEPVETTKSEKKKKKKNKGGDAEEEEEEMGEGKDGEVETPVVEVEKMENKVVTIDDLDDDYFEDEKKRKKKNKKKEEEAGQESKSAAGEADDAEGEEGDEFKMKSAAQKKKEKKEREKQRKLEEKQKEKKKEQAKKEKEVKEGPKDADGSKTEKESQAVKAAPEADEQEGEGKKKKKKKAEKEEKKEEKAKPKNKQIAALREALRIQKEEEELAKKEMERFRLEEEERIRKIEEEEKLREEARLKKKEAKKEREAQLKKEGKWMTAKQRQDRQKVEQMLEAMKLSGVEVGPRPVPDKTTKKGFVYTKKKRHDNKEKSPTDVTTPTEGSPEVEMKESVEDAKKEVEVTIDDKKKEVEEEEVKDAWDAESEEEEEDEKKDAAPEKSTAKPVAKKKVEEEEEEDDDDDEDEDEDESESEEESSEEESDESESESDEESTPIDRGREKAQKRAEKAEKAKTLDHLRAPVVCVLGHVDTGKTKILDKLRRTNVQDGEAGGITQQIGATNVPKDAIVEKTKMVKEFAKQDLKIPGLLIIDTPGHESFSNLRIRGSSLCDIAILVIDIMHGLEPQTRESINLLKERKTPFLVALNKVDRLYQWKPQPMNDVQNTVKKQSAHTKSEFDERTQDIIVQLAEEGLNAALFYENKNQREYVSMVPTSAHTGDGMGNLVALVCELCQNMLAKRLMYSSDLQATVMEVKAITGMGTTVDVILINGALHEGDTIVLAGTDGPIVTQIRGLLMPQPMKELRVKSQYEHHKTVMAAQGVKINAKEMEKALAGLPLFVAHDADEKEYYKDEVAIVLKDTLESIKVQEKGVFVQASTLGSLEALLEFLRTSKIPYAGINIGPVHKKDIMRASVMLEHDSQYAVILAFDVKIERDAQELADSTGVRIFTADIIYHLFDAFMKFRDDCKRQKQEEFKHIAVFPCKLKILPQYVFNSRDPIVMGVIVESGFVKDGTPICVPTKEFVDIGRIGSLEVNHKQVDVAKQGQEVCIKILPIPGEAPKMYGRHFEDSDMLVSKISRQSIDAVKDYFRDEMTKQDWKLMVELKKEFAIL